MTSKDLLNAFLMIAVMAPPALLVQKHMNTCTSVVGDSTVDGTFSGVLGVAMASLSEWVSLLASVVVDPSKSPLSEESSSCQMYVHFPGVFVNVLYFVVVDFGFYVIYLAQGSTWLIDPHWQFIPTCIALFYYSHPASLGSKQRRWITMLLVFVWAGRLLHNYFRRERWHFGRVEDWRYAEMRKSHGAWWWLTQFFAVNLAQHGMLVGLTMPLQPAMSGVTSELNLLDLVAVVMSIMGIIIAAVADNQLWKYMQLGDNKPTVLQTGLWSFSRHPNHLGEQIWWLGILCFGLASGASSWPICFGILFNHPLDIFVTLPLIEERMKRRRDRRFAYIEYTKRTSLIVPMPSRIGE